MKKFRDSSPQDQNPGSWSEVQVRCPESQQSSQQGSQRPANLPCGGTGLARPAHLGCHLSPPIGHSSHPPTDQWHVPGEPKRRAERRDTGTFFYYTSEMALCAGSRCNRQNIQFRKRGNQKRTGNLLRAKVANKKMLEDFLTQEAFFFFCKYHAKQAAGVP